MPQARSNNLLKRLTDKNWSPKDFSEDFEKLIAEVRDEVTTETTSGKIASIFVLHQVMHEFTKDLIELSILYVQGEIWPTEFRPRFDNGKEMMTGWYLNYLETHCIECEGKERFLKHAKRINEIRNKVAHNIASKNEVIINDSYQKFIGEFDEVVFAYNDECVAHLFRLLLDLTHRVDFAELAD